jgi:hypothetical protein
VVRGRCSGSGRRLGFAVVTAVVTKDRRGRRSKLAFLRAGAPRWLGFQIFQPQFQLFDLPLQLLRLPPELHPLQLRQQQLQMLNLALAREQLLVRAAQQLLQCFLIQCVQIGKGRASSNHDRSMP